MTTAEQAQLNKLLKEGIELAKNLRDTTSETSLKNFTGDLRSAELVVKSLRDEWNDYTNDIKGAREGFIRIVDEIKNMNSGVAKSKTVFNGLTSLAAKLQSHQEGITTLSEKELEKLKSKIGDKVSELKIAEKLTGEELNALNIKKSSNTISNEELTRLIKVETAYNNITAQLAKDLTFVDQLNASLGVEINKQKQIEKALGVSGALMKGMSKIPFLGDLPGMSSILGDVEKEIKAINEARKEEGKEPVSRAEALRMTFSKMKGIVKDVLTDPLTTGLTVLKLLYDVFKEVDKGTGELAKGFNMTYNQANNVREQLTKMAVESGDIALNTRSLQETLMAVGKALGSNAMLNKADLVTFTKLREQAGFTNEELLGIEKTTLATGGNLEKNAKNILYSAKLTGLNNKVLLNEKDIMRDVAKASDSIKLSLGGSGKKLGEAAAQAKALGMSLEQVDKIAGSLLDFESSITNELSAELITGKQINLEQARLYALNNDMAGLSREIAKNFGSVAEYSKMNRIQQEAAAKAVGMSREELATTLTDQAALKGLSGDKLKDAQAALDLARAQGMTEEQIAQKGIDGLSQQQGVQERLTMAVEKMKEAFVGIIEAFSPIIDLFANLLTYVAKSKMAMLALQTVIAGLAVKSLVTAIASIFTGSAILGPVGLGIAAAGTVALMAYVNSAKATPMAKGGIIPATPGGTLIQAGEAGKSEAIIPLDNNGGFHIKTSNPQQQPAKQSAYMDPALLLNEIRAMRQEQAKSNSKPTVIENSVNGTRFGTAVAMNTYKIS